MSHGYVTCKTCKELFCTHDQEYGFERWGHGEPVQLINNPAIWGSDNPSYHLCGFSKGKTQNEAMADERRGQATFESIPFKGMRRRLPWLFRGLGLRDLHDDPDQIFFASEREFQSGSIIKCSISVQMPDGDYSYKLKDILYADRPSGGRVRQILHTCIRRHLSGEISGHSFVLFGLDADLIQWCRTAFDKIHGPVIQIRPTTYRSDNLSWVHVAHPSGNQTDPQYQRWCKGSTRPPKVVWAREELAYRWNANGG